MGTDKEVFEENRGKSDHCASLTGSDRKRPCPEDTLLFFSYYFPVLFIPYFFPRTFFSRTIFPYFFPTVLVSRYFSRPFCSRNFVPVYFFSFFFLSSSIKCWLGCSLRRPRPITIGNYTLFYIFIY
jgi:hypothetical protein